MNVLFKNVSTVDKKDIFLSVEGEKIMYIGKERPTGVYEREIDCKNKLMLPGFYNCHTHAAMTLFRGYGEDMPLMSWLQDKIFPAEDLLNDPAVYAASMLAIAEMIRNGIVSFSDMYFFCTETVRAISETGIKANISRCVSTFDPDIDMTKDYRFAEAKKLFFDYHGAENGRIKVDVAPHSEYTNVERGLRALAEFAKENGAILHVHLSETEGENQGCIERHGMTPTEYLCSCGCFDVPSLAAHSVWLSDNDISILRDKGVYAIHNPSSNLKLGSGIMPVKRVLDGGVKIALGTDSAASNNTLDMMKEMYLAAILQKGSTRDPAAMKASDFLKMATENGAEAQGRFDCGKLEEGCKADIVLIDLDAINNIPYYDLTYTAVYSANSSNVCFTMADGKILYENGEFLTLDIEKVKSDMRYECGNYFKNKK